MIEGLIRGEGSSIYNKRPSVTNNKYFPNFKLKKSSTFIFMIESNNLYGGVMENIPLPLSDNKFMEQQWDCDLEPQLFQKVLETLTRVMLDTFWKWTCHTQTLFLTFTLISPSSSEATD